MVVCYWVVGRFWIRKVGKEKVKVSNEKKKRISMYFSCAIQGLLPFSFFFFFFK
jgi:hypothetical protein